MADPRIPKPPAMAEPRFANVARVRHTAYEFYIDFALLSLDQPGVAGLVSSVVVTPQHAALLVKALRDNIAKYESKHGPIRLQDEHQGELQ